MAPTKAQLLKVRLVALKRTLSSVTEHQKKGPVTQAIADNFNKLVDEIAADYPTVKDALPDRIKPNRAFRSMGLAEANYIDLEILAEQTIEVLGLVEFDNE